MANNIAPYFSKFNFSQTNKEMLNRTNTQQMQVATIAENSLRNSDCSQSKNSAVVNETFSVTKIPGHPIWDDQKTDLLKEIETLFEENSEGGKVASHFPAKTPSDCKEHGEKNANPAVKYGRGSYKENELLMKTMPPDPVKTINKLATQPTRPDSKRQWTDEMDEVLRNFATGHPPWCIPWRVLDKSLLSNPGITDRECANRWGTLKRRKNKNISQSESLLSRMKIEFILNS